MSDCDACCTQLPISSDYEPRGSYVTLQDGMRVYVVGEESAPRSLVAFYDIFGLHNNVLQICDIMAHQGGFRVFLPDIFRGKPWPEDDMPPKDRQKLLHWAGVENSFSDRTQPDIVRMIDELSIKKDQLGGIGFCWGGLMVLDGLRLTSPIFQCGVAIHGPTQSKEQIQAIQRPVLAIVTKQEEAMLAEADQLSASIASSSQFLDFTDMQHGFCASRGDFSDPLIQARVNDTIQAALKFFNAQLSKKF